MTIDIPVRYRSGTHIANAQSIRCSAAAGPRQAIERWIGRYQDKNPLARCSVAGVRPGENPSTTVYTIEIRDRD